MVYNADYTFDSGECVIDLTTPYAYSGKNLIVSIAHSQPDDSNLYKSFYTDNYRDRKVGLNCFNGVNYLVNDLPKCKFTFYYDNYHTVTWKSADGSVLQKDEKMKRGDMPVFGGTFPEDTEDIFYTYTYKWDKEIKTVTADTTYTIKVVKTPKNPASLTVCDDTGTYNSIPYSGSWNNVTIGSNQIYPASMLSDMTGIRCVL